MPYRLRRALELVGLLHALRLHLRLLLHRLLHLARLLLHARLLHLTLLHGLLLHLVHLVLLVHHLFFTGSPVGAGSHKLVAAG